MYVYYAPRAAEPHAAERALAEDVLSNKQKAVLYSRLACFVNTVALHMDVRMSYT